MDFDFPLNNKYNTNKITKNTTESQQSYFASLQDKINIKLLKIQS